MAVKRLKIQLAVLQELRERANGRCEKCGNSGDKLEIDHIVPLRDFIGSREEANDISNLRVLCYPCHARRSARQASRWFSRKGGINPKTGYPYAV